MFFIPLKYKILPDYTHLRKAIRRVYSYTLEVWQFTPILRVHLPVHSHISGILWLTNYCAVVRNHLTLFQNNSIAHVRIFLRNPRPLVGPLITCQKCAKEGK